MIAKFWRRCLSAILTFSMLLSLVPGALAQESGQDGPSYFDFEASEYEVKENAGEIQIKILRHGEGAEAADVSFKAADFLSSYGVDYEVLDEDGNSLDKVSGEKPDVADFVYEGEEDPVDEAPAQPEEPAEVPENEETAEVPEDGEPAEIPQSEDVEEIPQGEEVVYAVTNDAVPLAVVDEKLAESVDELETQLPVNTEKKRKSTGSPLLDAQAAYLNLPEDRSKEDTEAAVKETLDDMYTYFLSAEGAQGVLHFRRGEMEKTLTIRVLDNDLPEQDKIFMLALMGTDNANATTAANATTYVTIVDDEPVESSRFDLVDRGLALSASAPEGYVTVRRTGGTQYFASVYVSTVTDTAPAGSYEAFEGKTVAFVPGETEKQVKLTAYDFSRGGTFGVRLEGADGVEIGAHYVDVTIAAQAEDNAAVLMSAEQVETPVGDEGQATLLASNVTIGNSVSGSNNSVSGGWKFEDSGDGTGSGGGNNYGLLEVVQYDKGDHTMYVSNWKQNLVGVKTISFRWFANTAGHSDKYDCYTTYFETDSDQTFTGKLDGVSKDGAFDWEKNELTLENTGDDAYIKFAVKARSGGYDNPRGKLEWFRYNYARYTFNLQPSAEDFNRQVYDFTQGTPNVYDTYYDGAATRIYNPGKVKITRGNGDTVGSFYVRDAGQITITDANEALNRSRGIRLKAVYFTRSDINENSLCQNGKYITKNVYRVEAANGKVTLTPDTNFVKTLRDKGVIGNVHSDASINVFPVYEQETVNINFENTDRDDSKADTKGKFDENHKASYFVNVLEAYKAGRVKKYVHDGWLDYYQLKVPKGSVIRVQTQPDSSRTAAGVTYWYHGRDGSYTTYYLAGESRFSGTSPDGEKIETTDYTKADIVADGSMSMKPATGQQTFDISYFPREAVPEVYQGANGLTNAVVRSDAIQTGDSSPEDSSIENGSYCLQNVGAGNYLMGAKPSLLKTAAASMGGTPQQWNIKKLTGGDYNLCGSFGTLFSTYLEVGKSNNVFVRYGARSGSAQSFELEAQGDGTYVIYGKGGNMALTANADNTVSLQPVSQDGPQGNQRWNVTTSDQADSEKPEPVGTDKDGNYTVQDPHIGMDWSYTAISPNGYYTQWVNMTGDTNGDGYVSAEEAKSIRGKSATMPDEVYGNRLSGQLDQDNFKLYYYFLPKTGGGNGKKTGTVTRASENFYQLVHNQKSSTPAQPVSGAYVDIGGFTGMTDGEGYYEIVCNDLPSAGNVSTTITADGTAYYTVSKLQKYTPVKLPALDKFTPTELSAGYAGKKPVSGISIGVEDGSLTVSAAVSTQSVIMPTKARFFFYNDGNQRLALEGREGYEVKTETFENQLTASLTFNPKRDIVSGDRLYVQFADQNGNWTNTIDLGYTFNTPIDLAQFVFPLVGASSLEDILGTGFVTDLIGNPMGGVDIGAIKGFDGPDMRDYTPSGINKKDADKYTWAQYNYSFGWDRNFYGSKSSSSEESDKSKLQEYLQSIYDGTSKGKEPPTPSKYATQSKFKWSVTPHVGFNLTLSSGRPNDGGGKTYFEDLVFFVKIDFGVSSKNTIQLPIGMSVLIEAGLSGDVAGIYHMYVDYHDSYETEDAVLYDENFGIFKKFTNSVRREGYIFIDPKVAIGLGVGYGVVFVKGKATFDFDMDFQFTETGINSYGDVTFGMGWGIDLFGFEVYYKELWDHTEKMFNSEGTNEHIEFDYQSQANAAMLSAVNGAFSVEDGETLTLDKPTSRDYLENRSGWLSGQGGATLFSLDGTVGTTETTLMTGTTDSPYVRMAELGNGELLMVFIDDDTSRSNVNKRALYYSTYNGSVWSEPDLVDDDGTADDYPTLCDLGNGQILVAWSSAEAVLGDDATAEDMMKSMNLKAAFFDKSAKTMGSVTQLTKTTDEDFAADVLPGAAFDPTTNKVILYYTKTEYNNLANVEDIGKAISVNAYLFYDVANQKWSDAGDYTADELTGIADPDAYKENWYGQRFLDLRLNKASPDMPRVVDSAAIGYNGLGLFAWTVDWDNDLNTADDRDVFMQIYNFSENSFTHIIRVTGESANYTSPKFARSDNQTYLFYGASVEEEDHGSIMYLNVSRPIKNQQYTKVTGEGGSEYYVFQYERAAETYTETDGETVTVPAQTISITADAATVCDNPSDYDVKVSPDGQMYLFWTELDDTSRQIVAAAYDGDDTQDEDTDVAEDQLPADTTSSSVPEVFWSEPVRLTSAADNEYYSSLGAAALANGDLVVVSAKGNYGDTANTSLVFNKHVPFAQVEVSGLSFSEDYPQPLSTVDLTATVQNEGLKTYHITEDTSLIVTFTQNGEVLGTAAIAKSIPGGGSAQTVYRVTLPEELSNVTYGAYVTEGEAVSLKLEPQAKVTLENAQFVRQTDELGQESVSFRAALTNSGNAAAENVAITAMARETQVGTMTLERLNANETQEVTMTLDIPDAAYTINEYGVGVAEIDISVASGDETLTGFIGSVEKAFEANAIALLDKVTDVTLANSGRYTMKSGEEKDIQPTIQGVDNGSLMVQWLESSDTDIAYIDYDNQINADGTGTATLTGILVPNEEQITFSNSGKSQQVNWKDLIPEGKLVTVTATVTVSDGSSGGGHTGGSSSGAGRPVTYVNPFKDVKETDWFYDAVKYVHENGLFNGVAEDTFAPNAELTRAMLVTVLYRAEGEPEVKMATSFTDVVSGSYYEKAVAWAAANGIVKGYNETTFGPDDNITRDQIATIMYRYAQLKGTAPEGEWAIRLDYTDLADIPDWASEAVMFCALEKLMIGNENNEFMPADNATRAQAATVLERFVKSLKTTNH